MQELAPDVFVTEDRQRFLGLQVGARMTVLRLGGDLLVHSPLDVDPAALNDLGTPRWVLAPNLLHHLYVGRWIDAGVESWCAPGLQAKRKDLRFDHIVEGTSEPFGPDVLVMPLQCIPLTNEVVLLHRPSRTLVLTDLVFHFTKEAPLVTRIAMRGLLGYPGCRPTLLERVVIHREVGRREIGRLLELDFDRIVMAHGEPIESGGREILQKAFAWLF